MNNEIKVKEEQSDMKGRNAEGEAIVKRKGVFGRHVDLKNQGSQLSRNFGFWLMPLSKISKSR